MFSETWKAIHLGHLMANEKVPEYNLLEAWVSNSANMVSLHEIDSYTLYMQNLSGHSGTHSWSQLIDKRRQEDCLSSGICGYSVPWGSRLSSVSVC